MKSCFIIAQLYNKKAEKYQTKSIFHWNNKYLSDIFLFIIGFVKDLIAFVLIQKVFNIIIIFYRTSKNLFNIMQIIDSKNYQKTPKCNKILQLKQSTKANWKIWQFYLHF